MATFAQTDTMDIWYAHLAEDELMGAVRKEEAGTELKEEIGTQTGGVERPEGLYFLKKKKKKKKKKKW